MKNILRNGLFCMAFLAGFVTVQASPVLVEANTVYGTYGWAGEGFFVNINKPHGIAGCPRTDVFVIPTTHAQAKENTNVALAALASGNTVMLWLEGCWGGAALVTSMGLKAP